MIIKDLFVKPLDRSINGVVKADESDNHTVYLELEEYVVTNELERHFRTFFESYSAEILDGSASGKVGVWISGFFGSGKSHFLKTLSYVLANKEVKDTQGNSRKAVQFFDESKIKDAMIRADIDKSVANSADVILFNIDSKASSNNDGNPILNVFLRVFNEYQGFSADHPHIAHMERHLKQKGIYDDFKNEFQEQSGSRWESERDGYHFYQDDIEKALSKTLNISLEAAHKWFEESEQTFSVSVENFCTWVKEYLETKDSKHRILFLVDEVGQFIGSDTKLMLTLQTITENLGTICKGRAWIIVTSQADMDAVLGELSASKANDFSKIAGRFKTRLSLSSSNVDEVIQKRLLQKNTSANQQLTTLFEQKGDILKNQISFDRSGPTLRNFDNAESFVKNYPFAPYHFQIVQKVFEEIRKVGATGAHLAHGERSMLDAFQMAAKSIAQENIGALIPLNKFYVSVEGFLDTVVKRTIDQVKDNRSLDGFDGEILRTLFMIRYIDLVKGTLDNLVTLSIQKIDEDKLELRRKIDESLQRLERESLITRNGDVFQFLTNEERDITKKIKSTEISSSDENKELSVFIFKEILKDKNKFRYVVNKEDYTISRYVDGHTLDARIEADLKVEVISPLDPDYSLYTESLCITRSAEGYAIIKLNDDKNFYAELRTFLKTSKFIRLNDDGSQADISRILAERGRENQERRKRLLFVIEEQLMQSTVYALGQCLSPKANSITLRFDEICQYLLENTYTKLSYLRVFQAEPWREINAILHSDDIAQINLSLEGEAGNAQAMQEVEQFISLRTQHDSLLLSDAIERFIKKPYGWPDAEIIMVLTKLAALGRISLMLSGATLALKDALEPLQNSRRRREITIIRKRQTEELKLKQVRQLGQDLFSSMGPVAEKELYEFCQRHFKKWRDDFKNYKHKVELGHFPGKQTIEKSLLMLERLLAHNDSFEFFEKMLENKNDYLDLEEDYRDIHEFFSNQLPTWQLLQKSLRQFERNKQALESDEVAKKTLQDLYAIESNPAPYNVLHKVAELVKTVEDINQAMLLKQRELALTVVESKVQQLEVEIHKSGIASPELSNRLLRPLQLLKPILEQEVSIANIYMVQNHTLTERLDEALYELDRLIQHQQPPMNKALGEGAQNEIKDATPKAYVPPKPIVEVTPASIFSQVSANIYIETEQDIEQLLAALKKELQQAIANNKRVRIR